MKFRVFRTNLSFGFNGLGKELEKTEICTCDSASQSLLIADLLNRNSAMLRDIEFERRKSDRNFIPSNVSFGVEEVE